MKVKVELTKAEICHLRDLLEERYHDGSYYGNKAQYYKRTIDLGCKLNIALASLKKNDKTPNNSPPV